MRGSQGKKRFTEEEDARYWAEKRRLYIVKNNMLMEDDDYLLTTAYDFYRFIFSDDFLQVKAEIGEDGKPIIVKDGKPNAIALVITDQMHLKRKKMKELRESSDGRMVEVEVEKEIEVPKVHRYTVTDDLDALDTIRKESMEKNWPAYLSCVSYFGKSNNSYNARYLHAFAVDLDEVNEANLSNLLKQIRNSWTDGIAKGASLPQPTFIVNSGRGFHLYYVLENPIPLIPRNIPFLKELKRCLTDVVWTDYTSGLGNEGKQYQGIYQGFRMVGTSTRLNGKREGDKREVPYEAVAYACVPNGADAPWRVSLDYLVEYCGIRGKDIPAKLVNLARSAGRTPLEEAAKKWPEWYEKRIVRGEPPSNKTYTTKRAAYDWWYRTIRDKAVVHGRYYALLNLVAYARKCGISYDEVERDAYSLFDRFEELTDDPGNHFRKYDVDCALSAYGNDSLIKWTNENMLHRSKIEHTPSVPRRPKGKRMKQKDHLAIARNQKKYRSEELGEDVKGGRRLGTGTKRDVVRSYAEAHPDASHSEMAKALGISRTTVIKWLKPASGVSKFESVMAAGEIGGGQVSVDSLLGLGFGLSSRRKTGDK